MREKDDQGGDSNLFGRWAAALSLLSVAVMWGMNMPIMKFALNRMDNDFLLFNALRLTLSAVVLGLLFRAQQRPLIARNVEAPSVKRQWSLLLLFAFFTGFIYQVLFLLGINGTSAGNTALIMSTIPMWTAILALLLLKENLSKMAWTGLCIALVGTMVVTLSKDHSQANTNTLWGNLLVILAALSWASGTVWSRPLMNNASPVGLAFFSVAITAPLHWLIAYKQLPRLGIVFEDGWLIAAILYSGIFSTGIAYALWNFGVKQIGAAHSAAYQNLVPVIALISSWLLIGEIPYALQIVGGILIIAGLVTMKRQTPNGAQK